MIISGGIEVNYFAQIRGILEKNLAASPKWVCREDSSVFITNFERLWESFLIVGKLPYGQTLAQNSLEYVAVILNNLKMGIFIIKQNII